ncbi:Probable D-2-hydroxyglutarate dehydrogenase, mitochondrial [Seminavis robusta]|uniref:Probable D-2-hydroxyglutarate dehydrogenase, mitochondrial n=1 Tax=Seminavis robusta TaxID=568900 RepID=A0A9N8HLE8_9STRA|nr:Probable D-2-hydroxyglutarate dehydrogenase, mitochondrial [Seminavis robusta]|eukprot:Sro1024_g232640.1 Probable D-2-hydroxyglutarate dehydrogenase, mitochondrial (370) ;mRNA; r:15823-17053
MAFAVASLRSVARRRWGLAATLQQVSGPGRLTAAPFSSAVLSNHYDTGSLLRSPTPDDVNAFREMLGQSPGSVLTSLEDVESYNTDWTKHYQGTSSLVLRPKSTKEVSDILRYCDDHYLGVVPQAGNTGLVGGSIPVASAPAQEVILSIERMNQITSWNPTTGIITGQAGGILQDWQDYAQQKGVMIPVDLGSKGSCLIGGTVSTNAGGQYYARYKSLHANVVGLEVVLAGGEILRLNLQETTSNNNDKESKNNTVLCNLKDNTGYDLKHLFIGAEGSLGIVTKVALWCSSAYPTSRCAVLCACTSLEQVQECLPVARRVLGETLAAFEFMDQAVTELVAANCSGSISGMIPQQQRAMTTIHFIHIIAF